MTASPQPRRPDTPDMPVGSALFVLDRQGAITRWNTAAVTASGYAADELCGAAFDHLFTTGAPPGDIAAVLRIAGRNRRVSRRGWVTRQDAARGQAGRTLEANHGQKGTAA